MKVQNVTDVEKFFKVIDECKGTVELVSPEGDRINLKSKLAQYLSIASIFANGYIRELDLVARDRDGTICFVEVKLRSGSFAGLPREAVDRRKQERLRAAAACYLSQHDLDAPARFDVAEVYTDGVHRPLRLEYLENAF